MPLLTITSQVIIKDKLFLPNEQYEYTQKVTTMQGCGCGGQPQVQVIHYRVVINNVFYDIPKKNVVETTVVIAKADQSFDGKWRDIGDRDIQGNKINDYTGLVSRPDPNAIAASANNIPM